MFFFLYGGSFLWLWLVGGLSCGFAQIGDGFGVCVVGLVISMVGF